MDAGLAPRSRIFLYGPPASGKSTVGRLLAESLRLLFFDLDEEIERACGQGIAQLFAAEGEAGFRQRERSALRGLPASGACVIALGGGALLDRASRQLVESQGCVLCLSAPAGKLLERTSRQEGERPLLAGGGAARLAALLESRRAHYASFPLQLETGRLNPAEAAWEAQLLLGAFHVRGMGAGYDVRISREGLPRAGEWLAANGLQGPVAAVSDEGVGPIYEGRVLASLEGAGFPAQPIRIPAGEAHKVLETVACLWSAFLAAGLERGSTALAVGGGVVSDVAGFAAATYLRGIRWATLPTSLLAMVDACLGGKTGIDLPQGKNLAGAFHPPSLVLVDPGFLATLPAPELRAGLAEVVKHGVIGDPALFERCAQGWESLQADWQAILPRAMGVKIRVIEADPYEQGARAALNFGHTIGHGLEAACGYRMRHGEAVSIGMAVEARLAERLGLAEEGLAERLKQVLAGLGLPREIPPFIDRGWMLAAMRADKKRKEGSLRFALPRRIGEAVVVQVDDLEALALVGS